MKKILFLFGFIFLTFFSFNTNVSAAEKFGINYDANEHFNYFYEQKNNTDFYNFLVSHQMDFPEYINNLVGHNYSDDYLIYYAKDIKPYLLEGQSIPTNAEYVILSLDANQNTYLTYLDHKFGYGVGDNFAIRNSFHSLYLSFFEKDATYIETKFARDYISDITNFYFTFDSTDEESSAEFSYFISNIYHASGYQLYGFLNEIVVTDIYFDNKHYIIDDNKNYSGFTTWFRTFFTSAHKLDIKETQLNYFRENKYYDGNKNPLSLYKILQVDSGLLPPKDYESITLDGANNYFFFPLNVNDTLLNRDFYTYLPDYYIENAAIGANIMDLKSGSYNYIGLDSDDSSSKRVFEMSYAKAFKMYSVNLESLIKKYDSEKKYTDFAFVFVNRWYKVSPVLYYNPNSYALCVYDSSNSNSCTYTNPYTGESTTLTSEQLYKIASQVDSTGASTDIFDDAESQRETAKKYSELYEYDENGNISGFNVSKVLSELRTFLSSFIDVISTIFESFTLFFNALPLEIRGLLYFSLIGGAILLFWKLIH